MRISDWISDVCSSDLIAAILWLWQAAVRRVVQAPALAVSAATGNLLPAIAGAFALLYQGFLILSVSVEANLYLNGRYWLPFYVALVLAATPLAARLRRSQDRKSTRLNSSH